MVWLIDGQLIGPFFLDGCLTVEGLLEGVPLTTRARMYFQHEGAPPRISRHATQYLNQHFHGSWTGRGGPQNRPQRPLDLIFLDFHMWEYMIDVVYEHKVGTHENIIRRTSDAATRINDRDTLRRITRSVVKRARMCLEGGGGYLNTC
jgi:hypothetical protein